MSASTSNFAIYNLLKESPVIINAANTFSDDDDVSSFDSIEEDVNLFTPPLQSTSEEDIVDLEFWSRVISEFQQFTLSDKQLLSTQVQKVGIPSALRGTIWPIISNSQANHEQYIDLLKQDSVYEKAIIRDLHRTFPHHPFFQSSVGQDALFNVVKAYSILDPEVGYCQGLSFVAGPLLLNMPEEEAFSILVQLMSNYDIREHYTPQLDLLRQRLYQFDGLLLDHLPHLHRHFNEQGIRSNMYASQWFLTLFAYKFPLPMVFRIYDTLFTEGVNCLFRIGLALLSKNQANILSLDFDALVLYLKEDMLQVYQDNMTDLLNESYDINISQKRLDRLAKQYQTELLKADTEAGQIESLRQKNKQLIDQYNTIQLESNMMKKQHALVADQLKTNQMQLLRVQDENDALQQQNTELEKCLFKLPQQIEQQLQSEMDSLVLKNQTLIQKNVQLQDQLADMEALVVEIKLKYAQSEIEREELNQKLNDLKKWMNSM